MIRRIAETITIGVIIVAYTLLVLLVIYYTLNSREAR
jgi:hypothetical protein